MKKLIFWRKCKYYPYKHKICKSCTYLCSSICYCNSCIYTLHNVQNKVDIPISSNLYHVSRLKFTTWDKERGIIGIFLYLEAGSCGSLTDTAKGFRGIEWSLISGRRGAVYSSHPAQGNQRDKEGHRSG
jgi:hypothetical protein